MFRKRYWPLWGCVVLLAVIGIVRAIGGGYTIAAFNFILAAYTAMFIFLLDLNDFNKQGMEVWRNLTNSCFDTITEQHKVMKRMKELLAESEKQPEPPIGEKLEEDGTM